MNCSVFIFCRRSWRPGTAFDRESKSGGSGSFCFRKGTRMCSNSMWAVYEQDIEILPKVFDASRVDLLG